MRTGEKNQVACWNVFGGTLANGGLAILALALGIVSGLKTLEQRPNGLSGQLLQAASPLVRFLQGRTLWDVVPVPQLDRPLSISNLFFWVCVGMLIGTMRVALTGRHRPDRLQDGVAEFLGALRRIPLGRRGPVTNYMVMFNGPVTNPQVMQGAESGTELDQIAADLHRLMQAVAAEGVLPEENKRDACDLLHTIAEEATRPKSERKPAVVKAVLNAIPIVISTAKSLVELWTEIQPHLIAFFL